MNSYMIGQTLLNQFRVDAFVASGGMGAVYRVWDLKRNVSLAMKVLHSELAEDPSMFEHFQREANALKKLAHPNIVPFYGLYQTEEFDFMLERFIDGPSLQAILKKRKGPLPVEEALVYLKALCAALGYAHASGVVHCDVKPGNVMIDHGGSIYLTDFGIVRHSESTTTTMGTAGTPAYMAPEQIRGEQVSPATDIYSLGVLLYEMLAGQRPFRGTEAGTENGGSTANERIRYGHLNLQPPDPRNYNPNLPDGLVNALLKALAKPPRARYASTLDFFNAICYQIGKTPGQVTDTLGALDVLQSGNGLDWQPGIQGGQPAVPSGPDARHSSLWPLVFGLVLTALIIGGIILVTNHVGPRASGVPPFGAATQPPVAKQVSAATLPPVVTQIPSSSADTPPSPGIDSNTQQSKSHPTETVISVPPPIQNVTNGEWIAYSYNPAPYDSQNKRDLYMINWQTGSTKQITSGNAGNNFPAFSPDGASLVYTGCRANGCFLYKRDENGNETKLIDTQSFRPDWCPDPSKPWVIYENHTSNRNAGIWMIDLGTLAVKQITPGPGDYSPDWSPDCSQFAFIRDTSPANDSGDIYIYDLSSNQARQVTSTPDVDEEGVSWSPTGEWLAFTQFKDDNGSGVRGDTGDNSDLAIIRPDGTGRANFTSGHYNAYSPSWSPDGNRIVFSASYSSSESKYQLTIYSLQDDAFRTIIDDIGPYFHPAWSP